MSQQFHAVLYCKTQYSNSLMSSLSRILSGWGMLSVCLATLVVLDFFFHCAFEFLACVSAWHFTQDSHLVRSKRQNMFILLYFLLLINFQLLSTVWATWVLLCFFHFREELLKNGFQSILSGMKFSFLVAYLIIYQVRHGWSESQTKGPADMMQWTIRKEVAARLLETVLLA